MWIVLFSACSLQQLQERRLEHRFDRADLTEHTVTVGPTTVHYWRGGSGPPLLLLHGFGGDGLFTWHGQLPLADEHTLIIPDMIWFGGSTSTSDHYSIQLQVDAMLGLLDVEKAARADVAGVSYGGLVAFALAVGHPDRVDRLVIVDSPGPIWTDADHEAMLARYGVDDPSDIVVPTGPDGVRDLIELGYHKPPATPGFLLRDVYRHMFTDAVEEKRRLLKALDDSRATVASTPWSIEARTLVVWGAEDPLFPVAVGQRLAAAIDPSTPFVVLPDTAHAPNVEDADGFNGAVEEFLR